MDFTYSERTQMLQAKLNAFMDEYIYPSEEKFAAAVEEIAARATPGCRRRSWRN
jgi:hypothetical protein